MDMVKANHHTIYVQNLNEKVSQKELRAALFAVFSQCGKVIEIVSAKTYKLRGQAWIIFHDPTAANKALKILEGFPFYNKPMRLSLSNNVSDVIANRDGSVATRAAENYKLKKAENQERERASQRRVHSTRQLSVEEATRSTECKTLRIRGLPTTTTANMLVVLFEHFPGFRSAKIAESSAGVALVEFERPDQAAVASDALQGFKLNPTHSLSLEFAS